jgi:hypothetical protein
MYDDISCEPPTRRRCAGAASVSTSSNVMGDLSGIMQCSSPMIMKINECAQVLSSKSMRGLTSNIPLEMSDIQHGSSKSKGFAGSSGSKVTKSRVVYNDESCSNEDDCDDGSNSTVLDFLHELVPLGYINIKANYGLFNSLSKIFKSSPILSKYISESKGVTNWNEVLQIISKTNTDVLKLMKSLNRTKLFVKYMLLIEYLKTNNTELLDIIYSYLNQTK